MVNQTTVSPEEYSRLVDATYSEFMDLSAKAEEAFTDAVIAIRDKKPIDLCRAIILKSIEESSKASWFYIKRKHSDYEAFKPHDTATEIKFEELENRLQIEQVNINKEYTQLLLLAKDHELLSKVFEQYDRQQNRLFGRYRGETNTLLLKTLAR